MSAMAGPDPMDAWSESALPFGFVSAHLLSKDLSDVKIGYLGQTGATVVAADVTENTKTMLGALSDLGAEVEEVQIPVDWISDEQRVLYLCSIATLPRALSWTSTASARTRCCAGSSRPAESTISSDLLARSCGQNPAVPRGSGLVRDLRFPRVADAHADGACRRLRRRDGADRDRRQGSGSWRSRIGPASCIRSI